MSILKHDLVNQAVYRRYVLTVALECNNRSQLDSQLDLPVWSSIRSSIQRSEARFADL